MEIYKTITEHPDYEVSNLGNVRSKKTLKDVPQRYSGRYYKIVCLNSISHRVHRLVASAFIPNPENKRDVNHLDGNVENNCVDNLEWATTKENIAHAIETGLNNNSYKLCHLPYTVKYLAKIKSNKEVAEMLNIRIETVEKILSGEIQPLKEPKKLTEKGKQRINRDLKRRENRMAKLTPEQVEFIRQSNQTSQDLAKEMGVTKETINRVKYGKSWVKSNFLDLVKEKLYNNRQYLLTFIFLSHKFIYIGGTLA